jgi:4-hydroxyphenylpyruvate dioxygenase
VQHIAFLTGDIFATWERLTDRGFEPLEISPNYYDDLDARFALDGELLERLRAANTSTTVTSTASTSSYTAPTMVKAFL